MICASSASFVPLNDEQVIFHCKVESICIVVFGVEVGNEVGDDVNGLDETGGACNTGEPVVETAEGLKVALVGDELVGLAETGDNVVDAAVGLAVGEIDGLLLGG